MLKLDRVVHKQALNGKIKDIILSSEDFTITDYNYIRQFFDPTPLYLPNKEFIFNTLNYEINDLLINKEKQYNLNMNLIIKFDMYNTLKAGENLFFISNTKLTDGTRFEEIILQDGRTITVKVITFYFNSNTINLHSSNQIDEWINIQFNEFEVFLRKSRRFRTTI